MMLFGEMYWFNTRIIGKKSSKFDYRGHFERQEGRKPVRSDASLAPTLDSRSKVQFLFQGNCDFARYEADTAAQIA